MASLSKLESLLRDLSDHVPATVRSESRLVNNGTDAKSLAKDIAGLVMSEIEDQDQDYASSLLFQSEHSILRFLRINIRTKDTSIAFAQSELLHFIASYIQKTQSALQPYSLAIRDACYVLGCGAGSRVRNAAIDTLTVMVDRDRSKLNTSQFDIQQLYDQFTRSFTLVVSKTPMSTKGCILEFLGTVAKFYPDIVDVPKVVQLQRWCLTTLDNQLFVEGQADNNIVAGALSSLDGLVCSPHSSMSPDSKEISTLYKIVKRLMDLPENLSRYAAPLAALSFFSSHACLLESFLLEDCELLYHRIKSFCVHKNRDLSKLGFKAMNSLMKQVSCTLSTRRKGQAEIQAFNFFLKHFIGCLQTNVADLNAYDLSLTIRGLGYFSLACKKYLQPEEFNMLKDKLIGMNTWFYSEFNSGNGDRTGEIPSFIQAYAQFANSLETIPPPLMSTINGVVDIFTLRYGQLPSSIRISGVYAVQNLLRTLFRKGEGTLRSFVKEFFYNTLRYTCSSARTNENEERLVYMEFVYLWEAILRDKSSSRENDDDKTVKSRKHLQTILYDEFFAAFLKVIKSFNLDVERIGDKDEDEEKGDSDDSTAENNADMDIATAYGNLRPLNRTDFNLFYNITQFWCILLPRLPSDRLRDWMHISGNAFIELSLRKPLVSGFYKMLSVMLLIANKNHFFDHFKAIYQQQLQQHEYQQLGSVCNLPEKQSGLFSAFTIFRDFLRQASQRLEQFKDELLSSCLQVVLAYPLAFFEVRELIPPLRTAFRLGLTFYPLAIIALNVLDTLVDPDSEASEDPTYLEYIIPLMNEYLMMDLRIKANPHRSKNEKILSLAQRKRQEIHFQLTADILGVTTQEEVGLRDIQLRMMRFLGRIGGINKSMIKTQLSEKDKYFEHSASSQQLIAWDPDRKLKFNLPFPNARVELNLDELLPRICELAELAPDRQVKVAACELLHGIVIMMIGNSAFEGRATRGPIESRYIKLYTRIFPVILRLAVDIDQVARTMFRSLNGQLIHWLTNNAQYENSETICLLTTCLNAACGRDSGLRDYAADCVREFVRWSLKQTIEESSPMNIRSLLKRLYLLLSNPSTRQRLGACMIFNRIYREYGRREELIDQYLLEILYHLFFCLKLGEDDHPLVGTRQQAQEAIAHLRRILRKRAAVFFEDNHGRRKVPDLEKADLSSFVAWSIRQVGQLQREYAKQCMEFFIEFVRHLPGIKNGRSWMKKTLANDPNHLMDTFEPSRLDPSQMGKPGTALLWLKQLNCTMDAYVWLIEYDVVDAIQLLKDKRSIFLDTCNFFLKNTPRDLLQRQGSESQFEESKGNAIYAYVSYQLVRLFTLGIRSRDCDEVIAVIERSGILFSQAFVTHVAQMLLLPAQYYDAVQIEQRTLSTWLSEDKVRQSARALVQSMLESGPTKFIRQFSKAAANIIYAEGISLANLEINQGSLNDMLQTVEGIKIFQDLKMLDMVCREAPASSGNVPDAQEYCRSLFGKFMEFRDTNEPANIKLLGEMLKIAFNLQGFAAVHAQKLLLISDEKLTDRSRTYQKFSNFINDCYATNFKVFGPLFIANIEDDFVQQAVLGLLKHLADNRISHRREIMSFMNDLASVTTFLKDLITVWSDSSKLTNAILAIKLIFTADPAVLSRNKAQPIFAVFCEALYSFLDKNVPLSIKSEAFDLLPIYITTQGDHLEKISALLKETINRQFPTLSSDLAPNTEMRNTYITSLDKLLKLMARHQSNMIFKILLPIFIQEDNHIHESAINQSIGEFAAHLGHIRFAQVINICFDYFKDKELKITWRRHVVEIMVSLLALVPHDILLEFYSSNLADIMGIVNRPLLRRGSDDEIIQDLDEKFCAFRLMEALYTRVSKGGDVHGKNSALAMDWERYCKENKDGTLLTSQIMQQSMALRTVKDPRDTAEVAAAKRRCMQAAYNALAIAINRTQASERIFRACLFQDTEKSPLWANLVDIDKPIDLRAEQQRPMAKMRIEDFRKTSVSRGSYEGRKANYMASMRLGGSSLSQVSLSEMLADLDKTAVAATSAADDEAIEREGFESPSNDMGDTVIEADQFTQHPCAAPLSQIMKRLHDKIAPPKQGSTTMPEWMKALHKSFTSSNTALNVKLFLGKLIVVHPYIFEVYAEHWVRPLMQLATEGTSYGEAISYYVNDLCCLIAIWGENVSLNDGYNDEVLLNRFVTYLMKNAYHAIPAVMKNNIQLVKAIFDIWSKHIVIPTKIILQEATTREKRANQLGLQFAGMVLAHDIDPYYDGPKADVEGLSEISFYEKIASNFSHHYRDVAADAAEVLSWATEFKKRHGKQTETLETLIISKISAMDPLRNEKADTVRFLICLSRVQLHYPEIVQQFCTKVVYLIPRLYGNIKAVALQIIGNSTDTIDNMFHELMSKGLLKMLKHRNDQAQLTLLDIINKIAPTLNSDQINSLLDTLSSTFTQHPVLECRARYYSFLQTANNDVMDSSPLKDKIKDCLLRGLMDPSEYIRMNLATYLKSQFGLNDNIFERLKSVLSMYAPEVENLYILYAIQIILDSTKESYAYEQPIFDNPLPTAKFGGAIQNINTSWQQNSSMTPLFVASQDYVPVRIQSEDDELEGEIRVTQDTYEFSMTPSAAGGSSLLASFGSGSTLRSSTNGTEGEDGNSDATQKEPFEQDRRGARYARLRKRIIQQSDNERRAFFRSWHDREQKRRFKDEAARKQAEEKRVVLTRKYRVGELPDVQIKHREIIEPLQTLGRNDNEIARLLHAALVVSITHNAESTYDDDDNYRENVLALIRSNLERSVDAFPPAIGSFLRICYELNVKDLVSSLVSAISKKSFNEHIGIALLEKQRIMGLHAPANAKKPRKAVTVSNIGSDKKRWIDLGMLYRSIDEPEIFQFLYQLHVASVQLTKDAINSEIDGQFANACNLFEKAYEQYHTEVDIEEAGFWLRERLHCYEQLTQWDDIAINLDFFIKGDMWEDSNRDENMNYFMRSFTKLRDGYIDSENDHVMWSAENPNPVTKLISSAKEIPSQQEYLIRHFGCDLSLNAIHEKDFDRARYYIRHSYDAFFSTWTSLHPLAHSSRMKQLAKLERTVELDDFLNIVLDFQRSTVTAEKQAIYLKNLMGRYPDYRLDTMDIWDDIIDARNVFLDNISMFASRHQDNVDIREELQTCRKHFQMTMMAAARLQRNVNVAVNRFKILEEIGIDQEERSLIILQNDMKILETITSEEKKALKLGRMLESVCRAQGSISPTQSHYHEYQLAAAKTFELARIRLQEDPPAFGTMAAHDALRSLRSHKFTDAGMLANYLTKKGFDYVNNANEASKNDPRKHGICLWSLAEYCNNVLRSNEIQTNVSVRVDPLRYCRIIIDCYFRCMELGDQHAIGQFPRLLDLVEQYNESGPYLLENTKSFDTVWMYIRWIPQLVAILDTPIAVNVFPALHKLAKRYPNALYYPFNISNRLYKNAASVPQDNREEIKKLQDVLHSPLMERIVKELRRLTHPQHILRDFVEFLDDAREHNAHDEDAIMAEFREVHSLVLDPRDKTLGQIPQRFANIYGSRIFEILGKNGSKLMKTSAKDLNNLRNLLKEADADDKITRSASLNTLAGFSPWLAKFHGTDYDEEIEIPGQYTGLATPDPALHAKIVRFDERILIMRSLRKPKRVTIYGTDEKKHMFLVKGGEDLRLDQRIEQLFEISNRILRKNPYCARQGAHIRTYKVVPLSTNVGIIEWISDIRPLVDCGISQTPGYQAARKKFSDFYKPAPFAYVKKIDVPREEIVSLFETTCAMLPKNGLRRYLLNLAASPEAFLYIRKDFVHSLAAINIVGYIVGIGDRHLENFLVDQNSGQLIPIDFGHAFGSATELIPVPELMPFRLTRCFESVMEPLGMSMIEVPMTHILQTLQLNKDILLNAMDVFVKEPHLEWQKNALKQTGTQRSMSSGQDHTGGSQSGRRSVAAPASASTSMDQDITWYPEQKLDTARRKLQGENPAYTMAASGERNGFFRRAKKEHVIQQIAMGDPEFNYRATVDKKCVNAKEQVKCLIDLATDPNILGRTWFGWNPLV